MPCWIKHIIQVWYPKLENCASVRRPFGRSPPFKRLSPPAAPNHASERASERGTSTIIHPRSIHPFVPSSSFISVRKNSARRRNHPRFRGRAPRPPPLPSGDPCNLMMVFSKSGHGGAVQRRCFHPLERLFVSKNSNNPFLRHSLSGGPRRGRRKMGS